MAFKPLALATLARVKLRARRAMTDHQLAFVRAKLYAISARLLGGVRKRQRGFELAMMVDAGLSDDEATLRMANESHLSKIAENPQPHKAPCLRRRRACRINVGVQTRGS